MVPYKGDQPRNTYKIPIDISDSKFFEKLEKGITNGHTNTPNNPYGQNIFTVIKERSESKLGLKPSDILVMGRELYERGVLFTINVPYNRPNLDPQEFKEKIAEVLEEIANEMGISGVCKKTR